MPDENIRDNLERMTLEEAVYQYLPSDPTFFERDTADRIIQIAKDYNPESAGTKLEVSLVAATTIPVINELTIPASIEDFCVKKQALFDIFHEYFPVIEQLDRDQNNIIGRLSAWLFVLTNNYGLYNTEELLRVKAISDVSEINWLARPMSKYYKNYRTASDKKTTSNIAVAEALAARSFNAIIAAIFGKYRAPQPDHGLSIEQARRVANVIFIGVQSKKSIHTTNPDPDLLVLEDEARLNSVALFDPCDFVFLTEPSSRKEFGQYFRKLRQKIKPHFVIIGAEDHYAKEELAKEAREDGFILLWNAEHDPSTTTNLIKMLQDAIQRYT